MSPFLLVFFSPPASPAHRQARGSREGGAQQWGPRPAAFASSVQAVSVDSVGFGAVQE